MTSKEYLMQYRASMERTAEIEAHLRELKDEEFRLRDHEGRCSAMDAAVAKYVDACNEASKELTDLAVLRAEIIENIRKIPNQKLRSVLFHKYISGETWEQVAVKLHYSYRQTTRMHGSALLAMKDVLECPS